MKIIVPLAIVLLAPSVARAQAPGATAPAGAAQDGGEPAAMCDRDSCGAGWAARRSRFALGFGHGHVRYADDVEGHQGSLLARIRVPHGFEIELEMTHADLDDGHEARGGGVALTRALMPWRRLSPYLAAGIGGGVLRDDAGGPEQRQRYAELGGGLMLRGRRLAVALDVRAGVRHVEQDDAMDPAPAQPRALMPPDPSPDRGREHTMRGRILALFYF